MNSFSSLSKLIYIYMVDFIIWKKDNGIIIYFYIIKKPSCKKNNRAAIENNLAI